MNDGMILAIGFGTGFALVLGYVVLRLMRRHTMPPAPQAWSQAIVILLRDGVVVDASPEAGDLLDRPSLAGLCWEDLYPILKQIFPDLPGEPGSEAVSLSSPGDHKTHLTLNKVGQVTRLTIEADPIGAGRLLRLITDRDESDQMSLVIALDPDPAWISDPAGKLLWHNSAYGHLCRENGHAPEGACPLDFVMPTTRSPRTSRASLPSTEGKTRWFEVRSLPIPEGWLHFAHGVDGLIEAELAQRNFVQTLAKTFAQLPIGLAVFDQAHRLVLYNPALVDLTRLPMDFLSSRPNLTRFFDHLREGRMMPEPKSHATWRDRLTEIVAAAREDRYNETWTLPSGLTYKITGRPHPDGAVAFLLEDISAEISLTRRFRSELELTQSVIDCFEEAAVVFSRMGVLNFSNTAYRHLWGDNPDTSLAETTINEATALWQAGCATSDIWDDLRDYVLRDQDRLPWEATLITVSGKPLYCKAQPVATGASLIRFTDAPPREHSEQGHHNKQDAPAL